MFTQPELLEPGTKLAIIFDSRWTFSKLKILLSGSLHEAVTIIFYANAESRYVSECLSNQSHENSDPAYNS